MLQSTRTTNTAALQKGESHKRPAISERKCSSALVFLETALPSRGKMRIVSDFFLHAATQTERKTVQCQEVTMIGDDFSLRCEPITAK